MNGKVRVGFVGCGGIAEAHLKGLVKNPHAELNAFCDISLPRARKIAGEYGTGGLTIAAIRTADTIVSGA